MKIIVTGGLGYLGSALIPLLLSNNDVERLVILDIGRLDFSYVGGFVGNPKFELLFGDVCDHDFLKKIRINEFDTVIHLAGLVGAPLCNRRPSESWSVNVDATRGLVSLLKPSQKILFASTGSCYGALGIACDERAEISPISLYGKHKACAEEFIADHGGISMRFATVYGASYRTRNDLLINSFVQRAIKDRSIVLYEGAAKRSFVNIQDAASIVLKLIDIDLSGPINIGDHKLNMSKLEACKAVSALQHLEIVQNDYASDEDARDYLVDYTLMHSLGLSCHTPLESGLNSLFSYYRFKSGSSYENF